MLIKLFNAFVKITGFPAQWLCFRTKVYYEDKSKQCRRIHGKAVIISNHTSVFDYAVYLFVFFFRTLRCQMAEVLFQKKLLGVFLKMMGGIFVDRDAHDYTFMESTREILNKNGAVLIFPEGRLPKKGEERPLAFKSGAAYIALNTDAPIIPVFTNGSYFGKKRARVIIGNPIIPAELISEELSDKENLVLVTEALRNKIIELEQQLNEQTKES